ncbi:MAG: NAD(P)H-hydrate dehydratase [Anaerolineae bacterium]|nr:NAD(P)H-hydrate dehydratase [Anaerolineae bacterium]
MIKIVTVAEMRAIEQEGDASGVSYDQMMQNAGRALADRVLDVLAAQPPARIVVLVGPGNNGGDALVAGRLIAAESAHEVSFYLARPRQDDDPNYAAVREAGLFIAEAARDQRFRVLKNLLSNAQVVIDGVLGIGLKLPIAGDLAEFMDVARKAILTQQQASSSLRSYVTPDLPVACPPRQPYVIAVDCPSGLDCDTGALDPLAIPADETVTFAAAKLGQVIFPGAAACGELHVAGIGLPRKLPSRDRVRLEMPTAADIRAWLPAMPPDAHKGTFGKVMVVAGSLNYTGAVALAAEAAYRVGAGLVTVGTPEIVMPLLAPQVPEATWLLLPHDLGVIAEDAAPLVREQAQGYNALLLGPGWGREGATRDFLLALLNREQQEARHSRIGFVPGRATPEASEQRDENPLPPLVIDADGLNLLSTLDAWWKLLPKGTVLTPHPGEMARLTGLPREEVTRQRIALAQEKAAAWRCVVVLKGAYTVVAAPDGRTAVLPFAEPALATAGTGDVLAGALAGLIGQGVGAFEAAVAAAYLHGLAGRLAARCVGNRRSVAARDVLRAMAAAMNQVEGSTGLS